MVSMQAYIATPLNVNYLHTLLRVGQSFVRGDSHGPAAAGLDFERFRHAEFEAPFSTRVGRQRSPQLLLDAFRSQEEMFIRQGRALESQRLREDEQRASLARLHLAAWFYGHQ